jgi:hypothetical protein
VKRSSAPWINIPAWSLKALPAESIRCAEQTGWSNYSGCHQTS